MTRQQLAALTRLGLLPALLLFGAALFAQEATKASPPLAAPQPAPSTSASNQPLGDVMQVLRDLGGVLLVLVGFGQIWVMHRQTVLMGKATAVSRQQAELMGKATEISTRQAEIEANALATTRIVERAYVSANALPSGIRSVRVAFDGKTEFEPGLVQGRPIVIHVVITNLGKTPAEVADIVMTWKTVPSDAPVPTGTPNAKPVSPARCAVVLPGEAFRSVAWGDPIDDKVFDEVMSSRKTLLILVTVGYVDRFGQGHRTGIARRFEVPSPGETENLMIFDTPGYNYEIDV